MLTKTLTETYVERLLCESPNTVAVIRQAIAGVAMPDEVWEWLVKHKYAVRITGAWRITLPTRDAYFELYPRQGTAPAPKTNEEERI